MICQVRGCRTDALGQVPERYLRAHNLFVPAHYCRYCEWHTCELERYIVDRYGNYSGGRARF